MKKNNKKQARKAYHPGIGAAITKCLKAGWKNDTIIRKFTPDYIKLGRDEATAIATLRVLISQAKKRLAE